ncbi:MAG: tRNA (adenosine(37)-N6)-dimethylallyltransferase MiaA [Deltaproteobacteria bacterium]|nr:tRNA (adenosine(37)-N6)-dimethylallyltransferase MiaA [Deltaproteobacteria bacterium]
MKVVCVMGPTAVGKSDLAVSAALRFRGEIINADSMQVFIGLDVGTGMPDAEMFKAVPHHLFAYLEPDHEPDAGWWARDAADTIRDIVGRRNVPFVVGGTFFWIRALFSGLARIPRVTDQVRERVVSMHAAKGTRAMHDMLSRIDPETAGRLSPGDTQRILRAIEVHEATGVPLSRFHGAGSVPAVNADVLKIALSLPRDEVYRRINARVDQMVAAGLVEEVRNLLDKGYRDSIRPLRSGSYVPVIQYLSGEIDLARMKADVALSHRRYAKRQMTWLRKEVDVVTVDQRDKDKFLDTISAFLDVG